MTRVIRHGYVRPTSYSLQLKIFSSLLNRNYISSDLTSASQSIISQYFGLDCNCRVVSSGTFALRLALLLFSSGGNTVSFPEYCCVAIPMAIKSLGMIINPVELSANSYTKPDIAYTKPGIYLFVATFGSLDGLTDVINDPKINVIILDISHGIDLSQLKKFFKLSSKIKAIVGSCYASKFYGGIKGGFIMWRRDEDLDIVEPKICYNDSQLDSVFDNGIVSSTESLFITQTFKDIKTYQDARNSLSYIYSSLYLTSKLKNDTRISQISFDSKYPYRYCIQVNCKSLYSKIIKNTIFECVAPVEPWHQNLYNNTCKLYEQTLSLPFHPNVSFTQAKRIFEVLDKLL